MSIPLHAGWIAALLLCMLKETESSSENQPGTNSPPVKPSVVLVGHCMPDGFALRGAVRHVLSDAVVSKVGNEAALAKAIPGAALLLVNRVLDGRFDAADGIKLIAQLSAQESAPPMILISDIDDAQEQAEAAGAMPGFGKTRLRSPEARERMLAAVQR